MIWQQWFLIVYLLLSLAFMAARIGQPRTAGEVAWGVPEVAVLIWIVVSL